MFQPAGSPAFAHRFASCSPVEFAFGVAVPGSFAKVYDADNKTVGYADFATAVAMADSGLEAAAAYTVLPDADVGPCIDIDLPRDLDRVTKAALAAGADLASALIGFERPIEIQRWMLERLREIYLQVRGVAEIAILPSGRGAHALIVGFAAAARPQLLDHVGRLQEELRGRLLAAGLPTTEAAFKIKSYCRPPGSPHRLEGDLGIPLFRLAGLGPEHEAEQVGLLTSLAERGRLRIAEGLTAPVFPARINELLQEGRLIGARLDLFLRIAVRGRLRIEHAHQILEPQGYRAEPAGPGWYRRLGRGGSGRWTPSPGSTRRWPRSALRRRPTTGPTGEAMLTGVSSGRTSNWPKRKPGSPSLQATGGWRRRPCAAPRP
jgi:hypothetical protein